MTSGKGYAEVIGDPVAHSKSPAIHGFWLETLGLPFTYLATQVSRTGLSAFLAERRADPLWRGCNVTMPLKLDAVLLADGGSDRAVAAGAANILVAKDGQLLAGNTDVGAVLALLGPIVAQGRAEGGITLLGNGGAARAVLVALKMMDVDDVRIQARDLSEAYKLAVEFGLSQEPRPFTMAIDSRGLINATPLGMISVPNIELDIAAMPAGGWLFDMVTEPVETPLLRAARARGLETIDGIAMLVEQAAASFMLLFGSEAPRQHDSTLMGMLRP